jgi:hypothetical protein
MKLLIYAAAAFVMFSAMSVSFADGTTGNNGAKSGDKSCPSCPAPDPKAGKPAIPDVTYPFTFVCTHCGMKITIKSAADWNKPCLPCACGLKNIQCYKPSTKK